MLTGSLELQTGLVELVEDTNNVEGEGGVENLSNVAVFKVVSGFAKFP